MKRHPRLYSAQDQGIERETVAIFMLAVVLGASRSSFLLVGFRIVSTDDWRCRSQRPSPKSAALRPLSFRLPGSTASPPGAAPDLSE